MDAAPVVENPSLPHRPAVTVADQDAMDGVHTSQDLLPGREATAAASVGLALEAAASGIAFGSSPAAADHDEATAGAPVYPDRDPHAVPLPPAAAGAPNNPEINLKDLSSSWDTAPRVLYEILMQAAIMSLGLGLMTAVMARSSSSSRSLYRMVSAFCARLGSILCTILLVVYVSCSTGRLGWIAGVLFGALVAGIMTAIWIRGEPVAAADAAPPP